VVFVELVSLLTDGDVPNTLRASCSISLFNLTMYSLLTSMLLSAIYSIIIIIIREFVTMIIASDSKTAYSIRDLINRRARCSAGG
jgi:hypothetical protein